MLLRHFAASDFPEYCRWFGDAELNAQLGPMDEEWLAYVLADRDGTQYSVVHDGALVAVSVWCGWMRPVASHSSPIWPSVPT
ncbi:hypothetical protein [Chitinolyticbacter meiyuanensis]|uniref:hypothetical protein n=1 Tax=Chitinolyticbacter meiyuanensis TaxID=682798 RepID=UPI001652913A|nr:hypothetical protein [Chitinolyticbacter meiyuanensis]